MTPDKANIVRLKSDFYVVISLLMILVIQEIMTHMRWTLLSVNQSINIILIFSLFFGEERQGKDDYMQFTLSQNRM